MSQPSLSPRTQLNRMATGHYVAQLIHVVAKLGIADYLQDGPKGSDALATATGTHAQTLFRLLRAVSSVGIFAQDEQGRFALTPLGDFLRTDHPESARSFATVLNEPWIHRAWEGLLYAVTTGERAFDHVHGMGFWEFLTRDSEAGALFDAAMTGGAAVRAHTLLSAGDLSDTATLVDVGGGQGQLLAVVLAANSRMRGLLFDREEVVRGAPAVLDEAGVVDRCEVRAGDFFASVPSGGDTYVLSQIVHDYDDEGAVVILRNCRQAMSSGKKLFLLEQVIQPGSGPDPAKIQDINMLVLLGGRERTGDEYAGLLQTAGFRFGGIHTPGQWSVVEGIAD